jgi:hypothetical protein
MLFGPVGGPAGVVWVHCDTGGAGAQSLRVKNDAVLLGYQPDGVAVFTRR